MNNAQYRKTIENVAQRTYIRLLNDMEKAPKLAEKTHCVDFRVFDGKVALPKDDAERKQQQEALMKIDMRKFNHFINKPFYKGCCLLLH